MRQSFVVSNITECNDTDAAKSETTVQRQDNWNDREIRVLLVRYVLALLLTLVLSRMLVAVKDVVVGDEGLVSIWSTWRWRVDGGRWRTLTLAFNHS